MLAGGVPCYAQVLALCWCGGGRTVSRPPMCPSALLTMSTGLVLWLAVLWRHWWHLSWERMCGHCSRPYRCVRCTQPTAVSGSAWNVTERAWLRPHTMCAISVCPGRRLWGVDGGRVPTGSGSSAGVPSVRVGGQGCGDRVPVGITGVSHQPAVCRCVHRCYHAL